MQTVLRQTVCVCAGNFKDLTLGELSKKLGEMWKGMRDEDKAPFAVRPSCTCMLHCMWTSACLSHVKQLCRFLAPEQQLWQIKLHASQSQGAQPQDWQGRGQWPRRCRLQPFPCKSFASTSADSLSAGFVMQPKRACMQATAQEDRERVDALAAEGGAGKKGKKPKKEAKEKKASVKSAYMVRSPACVVL